MANVYVFTADGFEEIEGLTVVDLMRRAGARVEMVSISDGLAVKGSHGIEIKADTFFDDVDFWTGRSSGASGRHAGDPSSGENIRVWQSSLEISTPGERGSRLSARHPAYWETWDC